MATSKKRAVTEWVGGLVAMPAYVTGEGEPYRPEALFWMGATGAVLGSTAGNPGELLAEASASLREAMEHPMWGPPHTPSRVRVASWDLLADLFELGRDGDEIDPEARRPLEEELVQRFVAAPEGAALREIRTCHIIMDIASDHFNATIATVGPRELEEIVFDIIPRKVTIDASAAGWIMDETRAFYAFLKRELRLRHADACLRVVGANAVAKLEAALSDRSKFGVAKSLFMAGRDAGFDMDSEAGIEAWMKRVQSQPLPEAMLAGWPGAPAGRVDKADAQAKRKQRKARKRNR